MSGAQKERENKGSGSGFLSSLLLAGGAAAVGYLAHKLVNEYETQAQCSAPPSSWNDQPNSTRQKDPKSKFADDTPECVKCVVCYDNSREVILIPCGHVCLCTECSMKLKDNKCPICKSRFHDKKIAYIP